MYHLTENLCFIRYIRQAEPDIFVQMTRLLLITERDNQRLLDQLVLDPQSLPIIAVSDNLSYIKTSVHSRMHDMVKNPRILNFCPDFTKAEKELLLDTMTTLDHCNPYLLSHIYSLSHISKAEKMVGKFAKSSTIKDFVDKEITEGKDFSDYVQVASKRLFINLKRSKLRDIKLDGDCNCTLSIKTKKRNVG